VPDNAGTGNRTQKSDALTAAPLKKDRVLDIAPQVDMATTKALRYMARTKQSRTYLPYTFPTVAGTLIYRLRQDGG